MLVRNLVNTEGDAVVDAALGVIRLRRCDYCHQLDRIEEHLYCTPCADAMVEAHEFLRSHPDGERMIARLTSLFTFEMRGPMWMMAASILIQQDFTPLSQ